MDYIYLSPHLDDVVLSCGGLIWEQTRAGRQVGIWTLCAGDAPPGPLSPFAQSLHARWETGPAATARRRLEDIAACQRLLASCHHFDIPDCIYRRAGPPGQVDFLYASEEALFGSLHPAEEPLVQDLANELAQSVPTGAQLVCPLTLGNHVDHQLTRVAAERLNRPLWYYADYPYASQQSSQLEELRQQGWQPVRFPVSPDGLRAWQEAVAAHQSQISTFWPDLDSMRAAIQGYWAGAESGVILWQM
ncbi:MAG: PIG-L family deacetylase [Chloroflexota bacterium]